MDPLEANRRPKTLRMAMGSAPLEGAGRVKDTLNLLAHARRKLVEGGADARTGDGSAGRIKATKKLHGARSGQATCGTSTLQPRSRRRRTSRLMVLPRS